MFELARSRKFILFTLGEYYREANKRLKEKALETTISKVVFVDLVQKAQLVKIKTRAIYKNLEWLEKKKYISYENKRLALTKKGIAQVKKIDEEVRPYINVINILSSKDLMKMAKKSQTVFKR